MDAVLNTLAPPSAGLAIHCADIPAGVPADDEAPATTALRIAGAMLAQRPTWVTFFREVLGVEGIVRKLHPTPAELSAFYGTDAYLELQGMLAKLRAADGVDDDDGGIECQRVITLRIPKSLHTSLRVDAADRRTSMNQLCITRLLKLTERAS